VRLRGLPLAVALALAAVPALAAAPAASADTSQSANWAGYAIHRSGVAFTKVLGAWTQPRAMCTPGDPTYSSAWVGIGGYSETSNALEQIGTEADCTLAGRARSTAWYELVPAPSRTIKLTIDAGDRVRATVSVLDERVTLTLEDLTRHRSFTRSVHDADLDVTSAEWIVEAPSVCTAASQQSCQTLPLADFGSTGFTAARATATTGHAGAIDDRHWTTTKITLAEGGHHFIGAGASYGQAMPVTAVPSTLTAGASAFTVTYQGATPGVVQSARRQVADAQLVHGGPFSSSS
jgi:hypothetical protein